MTKARIRREWPQVFCVDCLTGPDRHQGEECPHAVTRNPEKKAQ